MIFSSLLSCSDERFTYKTYLYILKTILHAHSKNLAFSNNMNFWDFLKKKITTLSNNCQNFSFFVYFGLFGGFFKREILIDPQKAYWITHLFAVERFLSSNVGNFSKNLEFCKKSVEIGFLFISDSSVNFEAF